MAERYENILAFWILGLCNNFAYSVMLSAAKDILEVGHDHTLNGTVPSLPPDDGRACPENSTSIHCSPISTGSILLADIMPSFFLQLFAPFFFHQIHYRIRHVMVVCLQIAAFVTVSMSPSLFVGIGGVVLASLGSGLGEVTLLSLASHFHGDVIDAWSSGTGGAGLFAALTYAILTDRRLIGLTPQNTLLCMLVVPAVFFLTYFYLLKIPAGTPGSPGQVRRHRESEEDNLLQSDESPPTPENVPLPVETPTRHLTFADRLQMTKPLFKFMIPLALVYFAEYFINQGLVELIVFDCAHGFGLGQFSQYRWYQVTYQLGVFVSRSSSRIVPLHSKALPVVAGLQIINAVVFYQEAIWSFLPHIAIVFGFIFFEGLLGGSAYVNTFRAVHRSISETAREFSMSFVALANSTGIVAAGFLAIPIHNFICSKRGITF